MPIARAASYVAPVPPVDVTTAPAAATATVTPGAATAASAPHADTGWIVGSYVLVAAAAVVGWLLWKAFDPGGFRPSPDISAFAVLFIFAQALERVLEPLTALTTQIDDLDKKKAVDERNTAVARLANAEKALAEARNRGEAGTQEAAASKTALQTVAEKQAIVDKKRANLAVALWAVASVAAMLVCGAFGVLLLEAISLDAPEWFDIAVTGLAVGSGTKPLHDLISNIQKAKEQKEDPKETSS